MVAHLADTSDLREPEKVRACQEKALQALQSYTLDHYPDAPSKFGELLLRIPELQRTCQVSSILFQKRKIVPKILIMVFDCLSGGQRDADNQIERWRGVQFTNGIATWRTLTSRPEPSKRNNNRRNDLRSNA